MLILFSGIAFFKPWVIENIGFLGSINEVPLQNVQVGVWCAVGASRNVGPFLYP